MKKSIIVNVLLVLALVGVTFCLIFLTDLNWNEILVIVLYSILFLAIPNMLFANLYVVRLGKRYQKGEYEVVIKKGNWLLKEWLPNGNLTVNDFTRIQIAASYFALYDDENFTAILNQITNRKVLTTKSYWNCVFFFIKKDAESFNREFTSVFQPLAVKEKGQIAQEQSDMLQLMALLLNGNAQSDTKEKLLGILNSARVKEAVASY